MKYFLPAIFLAALLGIFFGLSKTQSFLSDEEKVGSNVLSVATAFVTTTPTPTPTTEPTVTVTPTPTPIPGMANHIVISEVQIDGGTGDADHDFIELYNPMNTQIDLIGHRLVSRTGNSSSDNLIKSFTGSTIIPAHGFYLWASSNDDAYPGSINANTSTTDQLTNSMSIALRNGPDNTGTIIDALSWNNGSTIGEGTNASPPGDNQSLERKALSTSAASAMGIGGADEFKGNGYDADNNATDFVLRSVSQPQNSSSPAEAP